jgi:diacylglycerol kinase (ATP)
MFNNKTQRKYVYLWCLMCEFSSGEKQFTISAQLHTALLNMTITENINIVDLIVNIKKLYNGKIVHHPKIKTHTTTKIIIKPTTAQTFMQKNGKLTATKKQQ